MAPHRWARPPAYHALAPLLLLLLVPSPSAAFPASSLPVLRDWTVTGPGAARSGPRVPTTAPTRQRSTATLAPAVQDGIVPYAPYCPAGCGLDRPVAFAPTVAEGPPPLTYPYIGTPEDCAATCAPSYNYYFWSGPSSANFAPYTCACYTDCSGAQAEPDADNHWGIAPACSPDSAPACPAAAQQAMGPFGVDFRRFPDYVEDALLGAQGVASPAECRAFCLQSSRARFYQWAASVTYQESVVYGECACLSACPSFLLQNTSPMTFVSGTLCAGQDPSNPAAGPTTDACTEDYTLLEPDAGSRGAACEQSGRASQFRFPGPNAGSVAATTYSCSLCNPRANAALGPLVDVVLTPFGGGFLPLTTTGISPGGLVQGVVAPGQCLRFGFTQPASAPFPFFLIKKHFYDSVFPIQILPADIGFTGSPSSSYQVSLGPCRRTGRVQSNMGTQYGYACTLTNSSPFQVRNTVLRCAGFDPIVMKGVRPDCTIAEALEPGEQFSFTFLTVGSYSGPMAVGNYTFVDSLAAL